MRDTRSLRIFAGYFMLVAGLWFVALIAPMWRLEYPGHSYDMIPRLCFFAGVPAVGLLLILHPDRSPERPSRRALVRPLVASSVLFVVLAAVLIVPPVLLDLARSRRRSPTVEEWASRSRSRTQLASPEVIGVDRSVGSRMHSKRVGRPRRERNRPIPL